MPEKALLNPKYKRIKRAKFINTEELWKTKDENKPILKSLHYVCTYDPRSKETFHKIMQILPIQHKRHKLKIILLPEKS